SINLVLIMEIYVFEGSLKGLLTAIFEYFERKASQVHLYTTINYQPSLLQEALTIITDEAKADRVWKGLKKKLDSDWLRKFYVAWHAEDAETFKNLFWFAVYIFNNEHGAFANYGNEYVLAVAQMDRKVHREK